MLKKIKDKILANVQHSVAIGVIVLIAVISVVASFKQESGGLGVSGNNLGATGDIFTPYKIEGFENGWITQPEFDGKDMPDNSLVVAENIDLGIRNSIAPRQGTIILGTESTSTEPIKSLHVATNFQGRELFIRTHGTVMEWWNPDAEVWETLDTGYTSGLVFSYADGNNSSEDGVYTYFSNGTDRLNRVRVAYGSVASNASTTLTINSVAGYDSADDIGFEATSTLPMSLTVNGSDYTYTGISGWTFTGMSGLPTFDANEGVVSTVQGNAAFTSEPDSAVSLVIKDQRLYAAYKNSVYCSKIDDLTNFSYSAPRVAGEGELVFFPDGGAKINAIAPRPNYVAVFKDDYVGSLEFQDFGDGLSDIPVVKTVARGIDVGATNANAVTNEGQSVFYVNNDIGPAELTRLENYDYDQSIFLSERIRPSVQNYNFNNSAIISDGVNLLTSAQSDDAAFNDKVISYNLLYKRFSEFTGINANAFAYYGGQVYYGDAINTNVYQLFYDQYNDNSLPYQTTWRTKWFNFGEPSRWKELGWVFVEGFIARNTTIDFTINLDDGGSFSSKTIQIEGTGNYVSEPASESVFGENPFGLIPFSDATGKNELLHFVGYIDARDMFKYKFRNIQFQGQTTGSDSNYRITKIIPFVNLLDESWGRSYGSEYLINYE